MKATAILLVALELCTAVAGLWLGEHFNTPFPLESLGVMLVLAAAVVLVVRRLGVFVAVAGAVGTAALFALVWFAGANESSLAFNECVREGEPVRTLLARHRSRTGQFPQSLSDLESRLPGRLTLPPGYLHYRRTPQGYALGFRDWLVEHRATESEPFLAFK